MQENADFYRQMKNRGDLDFTTQESRNIYLALRKLFNNYY